MTRMIDRLEAKDLLRRSRGPSDGRLVSLELTEKGHAAIPRMRESARRVLNRFLQGFTKAEARQVESFLTRMLENSSVARRRVSLLSIFICWLSLPASATAVIARDGPVGTLDNAKLTSPTLGEEIAYRVYLPHGYDSSTERYSVLYMLHGRGDNLTAWSRVIDLLDQMIAAGKMPPVIAIMPDAPWSQRASYYVDSQYAGGPSRGRPVESAFINDLIPHVDVTYRTIADRNGRAIVGYSMGGYGAIRYSLAHPDLFGAAIVLSPAVYT